jgi:hypothetical protein
LPKTGCASDVWKIYLSLKGEIWFSRMWVRREIVASEHCEVKVRGAEETMTDKLSSRVWSSGVRRCEDPHRSDGWTRQFSRDAKVSVAQVARLAGGILMLYPTCMFVMGSYAVENGSFKERNSWVTGTLRQPQDANFLEVVELSISVSRTLANTL